MKKISILLAMALFTGIFAGCVSTSIHCSVEGCSEQAYSGNVCEYHYLLEKQEEETTSK